MTERPTRVPGEELAQSRQDRLDALCARLKLLLDNVPTLIYLVDSNHRFLNVNKQWENFFGIDYEHIVGKSLYDVFPKEVADQFAANNAIVLREGRCELEEVYEGRTYLSLKVAVADERGSNYAICGFSTDITDRKRAENDLRQSQAALEAADARKDLFLATLSHELRNPLAPILDSARYLTRRFADDYELKTTGELILRNGERLKRLVDDLLDVSRAMHGKVKLHFAPFDLRRAALEAAKVVATVVEKRRQPLRVKLPAAPVTVRGDEMRLIQVVTNLLQNASKFSQSNAFIDLDLAIGGDKATLVVRDSGIGMSAEALEHVFEAFWQAETPGSRGGLGLGLYLTRTLVEMHGGTIRASSDGPGKGSAFIVELPVATGEA